MITDVRWDLLENLLSHVLLRVGLYIVTLSYLCLQDSLGASRQGRWRGIHV